MPCFLFFKTTRDWFALQSPLVVNAVTHFVVYIRPGVGYTYTFAFIPVKVNGRKGKFIFDTGNGGDIEMTRMQF